MLKPTAGMGWRPNWVFLEAWKFWEAENGELFANNGLEVLLEGLHEAFHDLVNLFVS